MLQDVQIQPIIYYSSPYPVSVPQTSIQYLSNQIPMKSNFFPSSIIPSKSLGTQFIPQGFFNSSCQQFIPQDIRKTKATKIKQSETENTKEKYHKTSINETSSLRILVSKLETLIGKEFNYLSLCSQFSVKRRVLYDFIQIVEPLAIIDRKNNNLFVWNGISNFQTVIPTLLSNLQNETLSHSFVNIFSCSNDSSLVHITILLLKLFCYLNTKTLDLRSVAFLFTQGPTKFKTLIRKLYTVSTSLEVVGILSKTSKVSEVKLLVPELLIRNQNQNIGVQALINTTEELQQFEMFEQRRKEFNEYVEHSKICV